MEFVSVLLCIIVIILVVSLKNNLQASLLKLEDRIRDLQDELARKQFTAPPETKPQAELIPVVIPETIKPEPLVPETIITQPAPPEPVINFPDPADTVREEEPDSKPKTDSLAGELEKLLKNAEAAVEKERFTPNQEFPVPPQIAAPPKQSFLEKNPDLEKFIGENLISKIGIAILVLAIGFFVKYAIDNDWIGPVGRVGIGILCGGILVFAGHRFRQSYQAFSSVLIGGGLAIFYFTITLAYQQFHIFSQTVAFVIMVVITAFAVAISQLNNRQELAIIAMIGGFATPFMASNGGNNYNALFIYLVILNAGLLFIAYNKAWRVLNILAFTFTAILFGSWLFTLKFDSLPVVYRHGFIYATIFYLMFFAINIAHNIRQNKKFIASDFGILLANTCLYFSSGLYLLLEMDAGKYKGLFTALIGVFNLGASFILFRNQKIDKNVLYLLIGITLSFISLTAPVQLNGHNITLFWSAETVLLFWLYQKSKIPLIRLASMLVWIAMIISLFMDWGSVYGNSYGDVKIILNRAFITGVCSAIASYLLYVLIAKEQGNLTTSKQALIPGSTFRIASIVLLYAAGALEINYQFLEVYPTRDVNFLYLLLYSLAFVWILATILNRRSNSNVVLRFVLLAASIIIYVLSIGIVFELQSVQLEQHLIGNHFMAHWFEAIFAGLIIYSIISLVRTNEKTFAGIERIFTWGICIVIVIFLSAEVHLLTDQLFYSSTTSLARIQRIYILAGLPILWGLCSFGFMWQGMKHKFRSLRIISLTLFSIILIKLFVFDIRDIPVAGKIAAFFSLGVLLLVISFMYQRLKKIIIEDENKPAT